MRCLPALVALALLAGAAEAQVEPRRFSVGAHFGRTTFDDAAGLQDAPFAGIDAMYALPVSRLSNRLDLSLGFQITASLPVTRRDQFPAVALDFGDTTYIYGVSQRVQLLEYGLQAQGGTSFGRLRAYALGGAGLYSLSADPRSRGSLETRTRPALQLGAGVNWAFHRAIGLRAELRNATFLDYDRDRLDPSRAYAQDRRIGDEFGPPVPAKDRINNLKLSLIFSYIPGGSRDEGDVREEAR